MVWRSILLSVAQKQLLVGCREHLGIKVSDFESKVLQSFKAANWNKKKVVLKCKKCFFLRKLPRMSNLIMFLENSWNFYLCPCKAGCFLIWGLKMSSVWSSVLLQFFALEMRKREAYRKKTELNVSVLLNKVSTLEHDRFKHVSLYTASWLFANT